MQSPDGQILAGHSPAQRYLAAAIVAGFLAAACLLAFMILITVVVARVFIEGDMLADVAPLLWLMFALLLGRAALLWGREVLAQRAAGLGLAALLKHLSALTPCRLQPSALLPAGRLTARLSLPPAPCCPQYYSPFGLGGGSSSEQQPSAQ